VQRQVAEPVVWGATEADVHRTRVYYWWLLLVIAFEYIRPGVFVPVIEATKLNSLIPLILFAVVLFAPGMRPFKEIFADRAARWIALYLGLILLSVPMVEVTLYAFETFKKVFAHFTLFLIIARVTTTSQRLRGIFVVLIVSHLFVLAMNPDVVLKPDVRSYIRGAPFLGDGNDFALSLCIIIPMAIELARAARFKLARVVAWAAVLVIILAISAPSMIIAWLKLRRRNLGPILDANGWAVNAKAKMNVPFGGALTGVASLPPGSQRDLIDPFAEKKSPWPTVIVLLILLIAAYLVLNKLGYIYEWSNGRMGAPKQVPVEKGTPAAVAPTGAPVSPPEAAK